MPMPVKFTKFVGFIWKLRWLILVVLISAAVVLVVGPLIGKTPVNKPMPAVITTTTTVVQQTKPVDKPISRPGNVSQKPATKTVGQPKIVTTPLVPTRERGHGPIIILQFKSSGLKPVDPLSFHW